MTANLVSQELKDLIISAVKEAARSVNVCLIGKVVNFYPDSYSVDVEIWQNQKIQGVNYPLPILSRLPILHTKAGDIEVFAPVQAGDNCLVIFSDRGTDEFLSGQAVQPYDEQNSNRNHNINDGFVIIGFSLIEGSSGYDGTGLKVVSGSNSLTIEGGIIETDMDLVIDGDISATGDISGNNISASGDISATGDIKTTSGDVIAGTISLKNHTHNFVGVPAGSPGTTLPPS